MKTEQLPTLPPADEGGFTLVECLIAIIVLVFGLIGISNLFVVAGSTNTVANHATATAALASEVMDRLRAIPFDGLKPGPLVTTQQLNLRPVSGLSSGLSKNFLESNCFEPKTENCIEDKGVQSGYDLLRAVPGVGLVQVKWQVIDVSPAPDRKVYFIVVRAQTTGMGSNGTVRLAPLVGERAYAEYATFRSQL